jgi:hypothetical protein
MSNVNGLFLAPGYGNAAFYVIHVSYGVSASFVEAEAANDRSVYFHNVYTDNFAISMQFDSWENYNAAANWFRLFMAYSADPDTSSISPMTVVVPSRNFYGQGIPQTGVSFGDHVPAITYPMTVSFVGALSSVAPTENDFVPPTKPGLGNSTFYPIDNSYAINPTDSDLYDQPTPPVAVTTNNSAAANAVKTTPPQALQAQILAAGAFGEG